MARSFNRINSKDYELQRVQDNVASAIGPLLNCNIAYGVQVEGIHFSVGTSTKVTVNHGLSRQPLGFIVVDKSGFGDIKRVSWSDKVLVLETNAVSDILINIYVY